MPALAEPRLRGDSSAQCSKAVAMPDLNLPEQAEERSGQAQSVSSSTEQRVRAVRAKEEEGLGTLKPTGEEPAQRTPAFFR